MTPTNGRPRHPTSWADLFAGRHDPPAPSLALAARLVANALAGRPERLRGASDPRRDVDAECGYPASDAPVPLELYQQLYEREPVAARVVQVLPRESWQVQPEVYEDESSDTLTDFEAAWKELGRSLGGGESFHQDEEGSRVWEHLLRADELCGVGHFGALLLGLDDGLDLAQPAAGVEEKNAAPAGAALAADGTTRTPLPTPSVNGPYRLTVNAARTKGRRLLYLRAFPEPLVEVVQWEANPTSPRYTHPVMYLVTMADPRGPRAGGVGLATATRMVHWSRVVHLADNLGASETHGTPRMQPVLNRLLDLRKLYAADPEAYWKNCLAKLILESDPALGGDVQYDREALRDALELFGNGLQPWLGLNGFTAKTLPPSVVDPAPHVAVQIDAVCIQLGIPKRVFMGSERGELASSQDDASWNDRLRRRQKGHVTPRLIVPFIDRLIALGVLPRPKGYSVRWPDLDSLTDIEKAQVGAARTTALAQYVSGGCQALVPPLDYLIDYQGMADDRARAVLESAAKAEGEREAQARAAADAQAAQAVPGAPGAPGQTVRPAPPAPAAPAANVFCPTGPGGGADPTCSPGEGSDPAAGRPSLPGERHTTDSGEAPLPGAKAWRDPPPREAREGPFVRPRGDESQTRIGDLGEALATRLGFRSILPEGRRSHRPGEVAAKGSTIDLEYDHSGRAYELKLCNTTASEYRLKAKAAEKDAKLEYARQNGLTAHVLVGVRDAKTGEVHFYAGRAPGLLGAEVSAKHYDYLGSVRP